MSADTRIASLPLQHGQETFPLQGEALSRQLSFWERHLRGAPALLELPTDRPRPAVQRYRGAAVRQVLPAALVAGLKGLGQGHGATLYMTLLAGWAALLSRWSGQSEIVVGTPVANRPRLELEGLIGFFANTLALRTSLAGDPSVAELLAQVKATTQAAYAHQDVPFEQVVERLSPVRSLSHAPLFQVLLSLDNTPGDEAPALPGLALPGLGLPAGAAGPQSPAPAAVCGARAWAPAPCSP